MVRYFEADKLPGIKVLPEKLVLAPKDQDEVDRFWKEIVAKNKRAFNGGVWTCHEIAGNQITVARTDYATATWNRRNGRNDRTMGTGILVFNENGLVLARRSETVVSDPGKISLAAGGVVDTEIEIGRESFEEMVRRQMEKELKEELTMSRSTPVRIVSLAIGEGNKAEWCGVIYARGVEIKAADEAVELIVVPRQEVSNFVKEKRNKMELSTGWNLGFWAQKIAKSEI